MDSTSKTISLGDGTLTVAVDLSDLSPVHQAAIDIDTLITHLNHGASSRKYHFHLPHGNGMPAGRSTYRGERYFAINSSSSATLQAEFVIQKELPMYTMGEYVEQILSASVIWLLRTLAQVERASTLRT